MRIISTLFDSEYSTYLLVLIFIKLSVLIFIYIKYRQRTKRLKSLKQSELAYRSFFSHAATPAIVVDQDDKIINANLNFEQLSGYSNQYLNNLPQWQDIFQLNTQQKQNKNNQKQTFETISEEVLLENNRKELIDCILSQQQTIDTEYRILLIDDLSEKFHGH